MLQPVMPAAMHGSVPVRRNVGVRGEGCSQSVGPTRVPVANWQMQPTLVRVLAAAVVM